MPAAFAIFFAAIVGYFTTVSVDRSEAATRAAIADVAAVRAVDYHRAVVAYWKSSGTSSGTIPDSSITLPTGLTRDANWTNVVYSGHVFSYEQVPSKLSSLATGIAWRADGYGYFSAIKSGSVVIDYKGYNRGFSYPSSIPDGAVVVMTP